MYDPFDNSTNDDIPGLEKPEGDAYTVGSDSLGSQQRSEPEYTEGEYRYVNPNRRRAYSDAGYVASDDAPSEPFRYYVPPAESGKKPRRVRTPSRAALIVLLCLACALGGGALGSVCVWSAVSERLEQLEQTVAVSQSGEQSASAEAEDTSSEPTAVGHAPVREADGSALSGAEVYELACSQAVAVTTEVTYTNIFGYTTSSAVSGSGFMIDSDGYILTNYHVIEYAAEGGYEITVLTYDGTEHAAEIVGYEEDNDIAVLKADVSNLTAAALGDSDAISVGDTVYAVGNPLGELAFSMTTGSVSALNREMTTSSGSGDETTTINMFQIDAAVNSGNSGGPVYNSSGEVIGVVTAKYASSGVEGLGFAIPINDAMRIADELITNGYVTGKAYAGLETQTVSSSVAQFYGMPTGAFVYGVERGSAADAAGLAQGDIITALDSTPVASRSDLSSAIKSYSAGDSAVITFYRAGSYCQTTITFGEATPATSSSMD
ncbi:MAG: S1C family serine protease [Oscillospiraceae bacterium]|nr:S1C family serine protease [Oscillospiraceae bacterium]